MQNIKIPYLEPKEPEYKKWLVLDFWSLNESVHLLSGAKPRYYYYSDGLRNIPTENARSFRGRLTYGNIKILLNAIERAVEVGILQKDLEHIYPEPLIRWAMGKGFSVPDELKEMLHSEIGDSDEGLSRETTPAESFIRNLTIFPDGDEGIKIQEPGKQAIYYPYDQVGFKSHFTNECKAFRKTLNSPRKFYKTGKADKENRRSILRNINKKLVTFFNRQFQLSLPTNAKLNRRDKAEEPGTYRFIFKIGDLANARDTDKERTLEKIEELGIKYRKTSDKEVLSQFGEYCAVALKNDWITREEASELLKEKEKIVFNPHENIE